MYKYDPCALKYRIKSLMDEHNVSQRKLAEVLGISQPAVSGYLNDMEPERCFSLEQLIKIANLFRMSLDALVTCDNDKAEETAPINTMSEFASAMHTLYQRIPFSIIEIGQDFGLASYAPIFEDYKINAFLSEFNKIATASSDTDLNKKFLSLWINDYISRNKDNFIDDLPFH